MKKSGIHRYIKSKKTYINICLQIGQNSDVKIINNKIKSFHKGELSASKNIELLRLGYKKKTQM